MKKLKLILIIALTVSLSMMTACAPKAVDNDPSDQTDQENISEVNWWDEYRSDSGFSFDTNKEFKDYSDPEFFDYMFKGLKSALHSGNPDQILELTRKPHFFSSYEFDYNKLEGLNILVGEILDSEEKDGAWTVYAKAYVENGCSMIPEGEQILYAEFDYYLDIDWYDEVGLSLLVIGTLQEDEPMTNYVGHGKYADITSPGYETWRYFPMSTINMYQSMDNDDLVSNIYYGYCYEQLEKEEAGENTEDLWEMTPEKLMDFAEKYLAVTDHFSREEFLDAMTTWDLYDSSTGTFIDAATEFYPPLLHILDIDYPDSSTEVITMVYYMDSLGIVPANVEQYTFILGKDENGKSYGTLKDTKSMPFLEYVKAGRAFN